jgi:phosphoserine phosphatase
VNDMTCVLTLVGPAVGDALPVVEQVLARMGVSLVAEPDWLAPDHACDLHLPLPVTAVTKLDMVLRQCLAPRRIDFACQPDDAKRRKQLLIADMDATILVGESLDELAAHAGLQDAIAAITARAMNGDIEFAEALHLRVGMLQGLPVTAIADTLARMQLMPGAQTFVATMRAHGAYCALVSGGFAQFTRAVREQVGFDIDFSNRLEVVEEVLTGAVIPPVLDKEAKLATLTQLATEHAVPLADTLAIGDGANDLPMLQAAGLGIAFHAKPAVAAAARVRIDFGDLTAALYLQGYRQEEFLLFS